MTGGDCPACGTALDPDNLCRNCGHADKLPRTGQPIPADRPELDEREHEAADLPGGALLTRLSDVEPEDVEWLWDGYLPLGKLAVLDGDPGVGKSTLAVDLAARVSTGAPMPDGTAGRKGAVLVLSAEDGLGDTIRPRLDAAGGDPARVIALTAVEDAGDDGRPCTRPVTLPGDIPYVEDAVAAHGALLVVVDVLMAYLSGRVDSYRDQDVRRALAPLAAMAARTGCCVLVLRHLSKNGGTHALYRGGGSIGIIGAARAAFVCGPDPGDDSGARRVLASSKSNLARTPPSLAYTLEPDAGGCARVEWHGRCDLRAGALLAEPETPDERGERDEAAEWLTQWLAARGGEGKAGDIIRAAARDGIARTTLHRARRKAGVPTRHSGDLKGGWTWYLPPAEGSTKVPKSPGSENQEPSEPSGTFDGPAVPPPALCAVCHTPMNLKLAEAGHVMHPACDPGDEEPIF